MADQDVTFLNSRSFVGWSTHPMINDVLELPSVGSGKRDGREALLLRNLEAFHDIGGVAAG